MGAGGRVVEHTVPFGPWTSFLSWLQPYEAPCRPDTINPRRKSLPQPRLGDTMTETPCGAHPHLPDSYRVCFTATLCRVQYPQLLLRFEAIGIFTVPVLLVGNNRCDMTSQRGETDFPKRPVLRPLYLPLCAYIIALSDAVIRSVHTDLYVFHMAQPRDRQVLSTLTPVSERPSERCGFGATFLTISGKAGNFNLV